MKKRPVNYVFHRTYFMEFELIIRFDTMLLKFILKIFHKFNDNRDFNVEISCHLYEISNFLAICHYLDVNASANEVTPLQNCHLFKLVSRQLSRSESIGGCVAPRLPLAPRRRFSVCHYHTHSSVARATRTCVSICGVPSSSARDVEVSRVRSRGKRESTCCRPTGNFAIAAVVSPIRSTISSFVLIRLKRPFRSASRAKRRAR